MPEKSKSESEAVTINIQPFLQPVAMVLSAVLIATSIFVTGNKLSLGTVAGTNTTATTTDTTGTGAVATTVSIDTVKSLYNGDYIKFGDANRKVLFVEVADPSCPYCHIAGGENAALNKSAGAQFTLAADGGTYVAPVSEMRKLVDSGQASYMYIYYPGHGNGQMTMKALYCAYEKGKFWEAHDLIMSSAGYDISNTTVQNDATKSQTVADFLKSAVDPSFMKSCLDSGKYDSRLSSDQAEATTLGVSGTPGFFVNSAKFDGAYSWTDMKPTADAALQ